MSPPDDVDLRFLVCPPGSSDSALVYEKKYDPSRASEVARAMVEGQQDTYESAKEFFSEFEHDVSTRFVLDALEATVRHQQSVFPSLARRLALDFAIPELLALSDPLTVVEKLLESLDQIYDRLSYNIHLKIFNFFRVAPLRESFQFEKNTQLLIARTDGRTWLQFHATINSFDDLQHDPRCWCALKALIKHDLTLLEQYKPRLISGLAEKFSSFRDLFPYELSTDTPSKKIKTPYPPPTPLGKGQVHVYRSFDEPCSLKTSVFRNYDVTQLGEASDVCSTQEIDCGDPILHQMITRMHQLYPEMTLKAKGKVLANLERKNAFSLPLYDKCYEDFFAHLQALNESEGISAAGLKVIGRFAWPLTSMGYRNEAFAEELYSVLKRSDINSSLSIKDDGMVLATALLFTDGQFAEIWENYFNSEPVCRPRVAFHLCIAAKACNMPVPVFIESQAETYIDARFAKPINTNAFERQVVNALRHLLVLSGFEGHVEEQPNLDGFRPDALMTLHLPDESEPFKVIFEFDGPIHYIGQDRRRGNVGWDILHDKFFRNSGYEVVRVDYRDWTRCQDFTEQKELLLRRLGV